MSEENQNPKSKVTRRLGKIASKTSSPGRDVSEQVPAWLTALLKKHGESVGPLIGLQDAEDSFLEEIGPLPEPGKFPSSQPFSEDSAHLTDLLEQMAIDGPPQGEHSATSVEWGAGAAAQEESPPVDDFLASMSADPDVDDDQNLDATAKWPSEKSPTAQPADFSTEDVPDWLTAALEEDKPPAGKPAPAQPSKSEADVPDWLTTALEEDTSQQDLSVPAQPAGISSDDVPDWMSSAEVPDTPGPNIEPHDVPDWLNSVVPESAQDSDDEPEPLPIEEAPHDSADIPDWLSEMAPVTADTSEPDLSNVTETVPEALDDLEVPDWLTMAADDEVITEEISPNAVEAADWMSEMGFAEQDMEIPDWLASTDEQAPADSLPSPQSPEAAGQEDSSWLAADEEPATFDWLVTDTADEPSEEAGDDWLSQLDASPAGQPTGATPMDEAETDDDWLSSLGADTAPAPPEAETTPAASSADDDWLAGLGADAAEPAPVESEPETDGGMEELYNLAAQEINQFDDTPFEEPVEQEDVALPDWLFDAPGETAPPDAPLLEEVETPTEPADIAQPDAEPFPEETFSMESQPEPLDWLSSQPQDDGEAGPEISDWDADFAETDDDTTVAPEPEAEFEMPDWLSGLPATSQSAAPIEQPAETDQPEIPSWLTGLPEELDEAAFEDSTDTDTTDWVVEPTEAGAADDETFDEAGAEDLEMPNWLSEVSETSLPAAESMEVETELDMPDWLNLPEPETSSSTGTEAPDWLPDLPPSPELEEDTPDWLAESEADAEPAPGGAMAEETPDWLTDSAEDEMSLASSVPETPGEASFDWMGDLREAAEASPEEDEIEETPDWLEELPEAPATGPLSSPAQVPSPEIGLDEEIPDWLGDLPEAPDTGPLSTPEYETEEVSPDKLPQAAATSAPSFIQAEAEDEEGGLPDWLSDLPEAPDTGPLRPPPTPDAEETDAPDWLEDLPEAPDTGLLTSPPSVVDAAETEEETEPPSTTEEEKMPGWLADLPEAPDTGPLSAPEVGGETEEKLKTTWLSDLPRPKETRILTGSYDTEYEEESPDWLAETEVTDESEEETPGWVAGVPEVDEAEPISDEIIEDRPVWLAESPEPAEAEEVTPFDDADAPEWLTGLPDFDSVEALAESGQAISEEDAPGWLSDSPEPVEAEPEEEEPSPWMAEFRSSGQDEPLAEPTSTEMDDETPDWLADLPHPSVLEEPSIEAEEEVLEMPDWLLSTPAAETTAEPDTELPGETGLEDDEIETPSWLADLPDDSAAPTTPETPIAETDEDLVMPDWLAADIEDDEATLVLPPSMDEAETDGESPGWLTDLAIDEDTDTMPVEVDTFQVETEFSTELSDEPEPAVDEFLSDTEDSDLAMPDWLFDSRTRQETGELTTAEDASTEPALSETGTTSEVEGVPDWLAQASPQEVARILAELEAMSDEEAQRLLDEEDS